MLRMQNHCTNDYGGGDADEEGETALSTTDYLKNIMCDKCKQKGHKAANYKSSGSRGGGVGRHGGSSKFKGTCNSCGKVGHKKADCWALEKMQLSVHTTIELL